MKYDIVKRVIKIGDEEYKTCICTKCNEELIYVGRDNPKSPRFYKYSCPRCGISILSTSNTIRHKI